MEIDSAQLLPNKSKTFFVSLSFLSFISIVVVIATSVSLNIYLLVDKFKPTETTQNPSGLSFQQMSDLWDAHTAAEFTAKSTNLTMQTCDNNIANFNVPTLYGGTGAHQVYNFYNTLMIPCNPSDMAFTTMTRTIDGSRLVDELNLTFTHTTIIPWMLPGVPPTNKSVNVPVSVVVFFNNGLISGEHIYWDQASVLYQVGLIDKNSCTGGVGAGGGVQCPISGAEQAQMIPVHW